MDTTSTVHGTTSEIYDLNSARLGVVDVVIVVAYLALTLAVGVWATCSGTKNTLTGYFLAGRNTPWWAVGASLFASNIGTGHFIGLAGTGAVSGVAVASFEWLASYLLLMLGWWFLPIYLSCQVYTMPEYIGRRYGGQRLRVLLTIVSMCLYVSTKIAVDLYAGAIFIQYALDINMYIAIITLLAITAIYTVFGGLKAVVYTDTLQTMVMVIGGFILMILGFQKIGGYGQLEELYFSSVPQSTIDMWENGYENTTCGLPRNDAFHIIRHPVTSDIPWPGLPIFMLLVGPAYWCTDQVIVQRALSAKSLPAAKAGCIFAGFLKITPMFMIVMVVACSSAATCQMICQNEAGCSNMAFPVLVMELMPTGLRGIMVASMLSALMSSLTSIFNSTSTIFTIDIWKRIRPLASEKEMLVVGKVTVVVLVVVSILWIPILLSSAGGQLFIYINMVLAAVGSAIFSIFVYGIVWSRANEEGAFWGLCIGLIVGMTRLILDFLNPAPGCDQPEYRSPFLYKMSYLYMSIVVFAVSSAVLIPISIFTKPINIKLAGLTWKTINDKVAGEEFKESDTNRDDSIEIDCLKGLPEKEDVNKVTKKTSDKEKKTNFLLNLGAIMLIVVTSFCVGYYA